VRSNYSRILPKIDNGNDMTESTDHQHTLKGPIRFSGIGLHTGIRAHLNLAPGKANSGIVIRRTDIEGTPEGLALAHTVSDVMRATTINLGEASVKLVEHVLAVLSGLGVDNAVLEMDGPEPPVADGSGKPFVEKILEVGTVAQSAPRKYFTPTEPIWVFQGESKLILMPPEDDEELHITSMVHYGLCLLDTQYLDMSLTPETFASEIAPARTFCEDYAQIEHLMKAGLIRGASLDNAMVIRDGAIVSKDGQRFKNELVRHKTLDVIGDLSLVGCRLRGKLIAIKPGHPLNVAMAQKIFELINANE
jgi:UDP-3-O-acyl N-acetylglucosamine deacetylase